MSTVDAATRSDRQAAEPPAGQTVPVRWNPLTRIVFRFCFVYFGLFCLLFAQIVFAFLGYVVTLLPDDAMLWQMRTITPVVEWLGRTVFDTEVVLRTDSGSGDQAFIWTLVFGILVVSVLATLVWTVLDRRRTEYRVLAGWFLIFLRLCLAGQMLFYGVAKLIPSQMPEPALQALLQPFGEFSLTSVLWLQVGSSPAYEILLGAAEVLGGVLLFLPRTALLGALLSLVAMAQVWVLNMTFDVPVKILSFHLLLLAVVLLAPEARRLLDALVLDRPTGRSTYPQPFRTPRSRRIAATAQAALGVWMTAGLLYMGVDSWYEFGGGKAKPELYGIWEVTEFTVDGTPAPPLTTDENRWQRLVVEHEEMVTLQRMDGTLVPTLATTADNALTLTAPPTAPDATPTTLGTFTHDRPTPDQLRLDGQWNGHPVTIALTQRDLNEFPLRQREFHWIQDYPNFR
ncbi:DoxX family protein [Nocardia farcinica]|uniref:DoxX family protein n=1 Tax=Nocardia farcinica TaxID=37329 RepID=UPI0024565EE3|nr:DoxX family protein [Nocardia farcinica]